jgi:hypothetical protein
LTASAANLGGSVALIAAIAVAGHYAPKAWLEWTEAQFSRAPFYAQAVALALLALGIKYVAATGSAPFVYTQF